MSSAKDQIGDDRDEDSDHAGHCQENPETHHLLRLGDDRHCIVELRPLRPRI
jgi:hypothetical protein